MICPAIALACLYILWFGLVFLVRVELSNVFLFSLEDLHMQCSFAHLGKRRKLAKKLYFFNCFFVCFFDILKILERRFKLLIAYTNIIT